jgi:hypothetical protein
VIELIKYLLCTAGGVAIGYYFAHARLEQDFHDRLERETDEARDFYRRKYTKKAAEEGEDPGLTEAAIRTAEALRENYEGASIGPDILTQEMSATVKRAVERGDLTASDGETDEAEKPIDWEAVDRTMNPPLVEKAAAKPPTVNYNRISTPPKAEEATAPEPTEFEVSEAMMNHHDTSESSIRVDVITQKAFIDNEFGYEQQSLTYFAGDDILTNEEDEPIEGSRSVLLGAENVRKILVGREAMDGLDTMYVRNHTGKWEFEVTRSEGKYSDEVEAKSG